MTINSAAFAAIGAASFGYFFDVRAKMENLFAHAAARTVGEDVVQKLIAAEQRHSELRPDPFNWERVKNQIDHAAGPTQADES